MLTEIKSFDVLDQSGITLFIACLNDFSVNNWLGIILGQVNLGSISVS
jgi:hypothetical protein